MLNINFEYNFYPHIKYNSEDGKYNFVNIILRNIILRRWNVICEYIYLPSAKYNCEHVEI